MKTKYLSGNSNSPKMICIYLFKYFVKVIIYVLIYYFIDKIMK